MPPPRARSASHVRLRPAALPAAKVAFLDALDLLDELGEEQLALSLRLACLERVVEQTARAPATRAAIGSLEARLADLKTLRDALAKVQDVAVDPRVHGAFVSEAPLADYARGLYAWAHAVVRPLELLAASLRPASDPHAAGADLDWALLRSLIAEAKNLHFDELQPAIRREIASLGAADRGAELLRAVEDLFAGAAVLETRLDQRFG